MNICMSVKLFRNNIYVLDAVSMSIFLWFSVVEPHFMWNTYEYLFENNFFSNLIGYHSGINVNDNIGYQI